MALSQKIEKMNPYKPLEKIEREEYRCPTCDSPLPKPMGLFEQFIWFIVTFIICGLSLLGTFTLIGLLHEIGLLYR
jgi:hypothetical protein